MPAMLKGKAKFKVPDNAKPGDEIDFTGTFEADQDDYERSLRGRLDQQKRQHNEDLKTLDDQIKELKAAGDGTSKDAKEVAKAAKEMEELRKKSTELEQRLATSDMKEKVDAKLADAGLAGIPKAFRAQLSALPLNASDAEISDAIESLKSDADLKVLLAARAGGNQEPAAKPGPNGIGNRGAGGSKDAQKILAGLREKASKNNPSLYKMLDNVHDEDEQQNILKDWDAAGRINPPEPKK